MELVKNFKKNFDNSIYNETFVGDFDSKIELPLVYESDLPEVKELIEKVFSDKKMNPKYNIIFKDDESDELVVYCNSNIKDDFIKAFKKIGIYGEPITEFEEEVSEVEKEDDLIKSKDIKTDKDGEIKLDKDTTMIIEDGEGGCDADGSVGMTTANVAGYDAPFEIPTEYTKKQKKMMRRGQLESKKVVKEDADWSPEDDRREREAEEDWDSGKTQSRMGLVDSPEGIPGKYYWMGGHWKEWDEGDDDYTPRRKHYPKYTKKGTGRMSKPEIGYKRLILSDWFWKKLKEKYSGKDNQYLFGKEENDIIISEIKQKTNNAILVRINFAKVDENGKWYVSTISDDVWIPLSQIKSIEKDIPENSWELYDPEIGISLKGYKPEIKESKRTINESTMEEDLFDSFRDTIQSDRFTVKDLRTYIRDLVDAPDIEALNDLAKETIEDWTEYNLVKKVDSNTYKFMD